MKTPGAGPKIPKADSVAHLTNFQKNKFTAGAISNSLLPLKIVCSMMPEANRGFGMSITDLNEYRRARNAGSPLAAVISESDPHNPDHSWHLIVHERREAVQSQIDGLFAEVESFGAGGAGQCLGIGCQGGLHFAIVETVRFPDA
jgi:hypothetical protein